MKSLTAAFSRAVSWILIHHLAHREPERSLIGIEIRKKYAEMADARLRKNDLDAAHVLRADAELAIPILLDDGQLVLVFPEGIEGIRKPVTQRYRLQNFRLGFVEQALRAGAPIEISASAATPAAIATRRRPPEAGSGTSQGSAGSGRRNS